MKKVILFIAAFILVLKFFSCAGSSNMIMPGANQKFNDPPAPKFTAVSVHDPSVFTSESGEFYVMGSHLATAKTTDFIEWHQVTTDWNSKPNAFYPQNNPNPAVQTMQAQIDDVMRGSRDGLGFYAGDIHKMPSGKFYQYYCITSSWYCSAIGLAVADAAEGPYITHGLLVRSGEAATGSATPDGTGAWAVSSSPNCIDPQAFFDKDNVNFYMTYGSWSGGIFIMELDPVTGMLKAGSQINAENRGYGRKLIRNNHVSIEGPYIIYSPETQYYYMFLSYGGLAAKGGYNMRVFRSRNPDGPYDDPRHPGRDLGTDMRFSEHFNYGVKIMGGYKFESLPGESSDFSTEFLSPGHNSVYYDSATGRYFLIYHQRFGFGSEYHQVRVCEMFLNEDGWFAAAPFRYDGGEIRSFTAGSIPGTWKVINHGISINTFALQSEAYEFLSSGQIKGPDNSSGTWELKSDGQTAYITIDEILYKGVFLRCYDEDKEQWVMAFTALSADGIALWGAGAALAR